MIAVGEPDYPGRVPEPHRQARGAGGQEGELHLHVPVQGATCEKITKKKPKKKHTKIMSYEQYNSISEVEKKSFF